MKYYEDFQISGSLILEGALSQPATPYLSLGLNSNMSLTNDTLVTDWRTNASNGLSVQSGIITLTDPGFYFIAVRCSFSGIPQDQWNTLVVYQDSTTALTPTLRFGYDSADQIAPINSFRKMLRVLTPTTLSLKMTTAGPTGQLDANITTFTIIKR